MSAHRVNKLKVSSSLALGGGIIAVVARAGHWAGWMMLLGFALFVVSRFIDRG